MTRLIRAICWIAISIIMTRIGYSALTWQFWAVMLCMMILCLAEWWDGLNTK